MFGVDAEEFEECVWWSYSVYTPFLLPHILSCELTCAGPSSILALNPRTRQNDAPFCNLSFLLSICLWFSLCYPTTYMLIYIPIVFVYVLLFWHIWFDLTFDNCEYLYQFLPIEWLTRLIVCNWFTVRGVCFCLCWIPFLILFFLWIHRDSFYTRRSCIPGSNCTLL